MPTGSQAPPSHFPSAIQIAPRPLQMAPMSGPILSSPPSSTTSSATYQLGPAGRRESVHSLAQTPTMGSTYMASSPQQQQHHYYHPHPSASQGPQPPPHMPRMHSYPAATPAYNLQYHQAPSGTLAQSSPPYRAPMYGHHQSQHHGPSAEAPDHSQRPTMQQQQWQYQGRPQ